MRRKDFEQSIAQNVQTSIGWVDGILENANLSYADVDKVILVGGSTRINYIQRQFEERFGPKIIQPRDEILARGAAVQAARLTGEEPGSNHLPTATVIEVHSEEMYPFPIVEVQPAQQQNAGAKDEREPEEFVEAPPGDSKIERPEIEPLFDYAQKLMEGGDYEEADEFLRRILRRVRSVRSELKQMRKG